MSAAAVKDEQPPSLGGWPWRSFSSSDESPYSELPRIERRDEVEERDEIRQVPREYRGRDGVQGVEAELVEYEDELLLEFWTWSWPRALATR